MVASSPLNPRNILVYVGLDLVGDGLIKIPFVRALRETFPKAHITWMAGKGKSAFSSLLKPIVDPLLDTVIENQKFGTGFKDLFKKQVTTHYDLIIDTQNGFLTALNLKKIPHTTFISSAFNFLLSDIKYTAGKLPTSLGERLVAFVNMLRKRPLNTLPPLPISEEMKSEINRLLPQNLLPYVGLVPGAGGKHKCWPLENFCELAQWLLTQKTQPVFLIGPQEIDWIDSIKAKVPGALFPLQKESSFKYSPLLTIALGLRLKFVISNDCGTAHMLAVSNTPILSLFGPTNSEKFAPSTKMVRVLTAQSFGGKEMLNIPLSAVQEESSHFLEHSSQQKGAFS